MIRVDPPGGGPDQFRMPITPHGSSLYWAGLNKTKQSVELDLKVDADRDIAAGLVRDCGIVLTNQPDRGWLSAEQLRALRKDLICVRLTGQPDGSPAVDFTVHPASGFPAATGTTDAPVNHVLPAWDVAAGLYLATGLLAAVRHRDRTGDGQDVRLSLADVMLATVANLGYVADVQVNAHTRKPLGNEIYGSFGRDFRTADERHVMVAAMTDRQWSALVTATGLEWQLTLAGRAMGVDVRTDRGRWTARRALAAVLEPWFADRSLVDAVRALESAGVLFGVYRDFAQMVAEDPWCSEQNPMFEAVEHPGLGTFLTPASPLEFSSSPLERPRRSPRLGEHNQWLPRSHLSQN